MFIGTRPDDSGEKNQQQLYAPVIQSDLKFAVYGYKFFFNYMHNLPHYIKRLNQTQVNPDVDPSKRAKHQGFLAQINVQHVASIIGLTDIYN